MTPGEPISSDSTRGSLAPPWPPADDAVRAILAEAYASGNWGKYNGPFHERLVAALQQLHGVPYAWPCCSGTFAVELALRAAGIESGQEVILAGYDFAGNFRAVEAVGAVPVLADIVPQTWCLDVEQASRAVSPLSRALLVSHLHGGIADMPRLRELADRHGLVLIEDACQAPGARVHGRTAGTWGDIGVLSFGGSKLLTAGRGGALVTSQEKLWQRAKIFCERGNHAFPLSELQAAVLLPQLERLASRNAQRRASVHRLHQALATLDALLPLHSSEDSAPSYFKLAWMYRAEKCGGWSRERFLGAVQAATVPLDAGFRGFTKRGSRCRRVGGLESSRDASEHTVILHHPVLLEPPATIDQVGAVLHQVAASATRSVGAPES